MLYQSKLGQDVELQNAHIGLLKAPRIVFHMKTLNVQSSRGSKPVDWNGDATSVPYGQLIFDLSTRTDDRLRYRKITGSMPLRFYIPDQLEQPNFLDDDYKKLLQFPCIPINFRLMQKSFASVLAKRFYPAPLRMNINFAQRKLAKHKKHHIAKIQNKGCSVAFFKNNHLGLNKCRSVIRKIVKTHKSHYSSRLKPFVLIWSGLFFFLLLCTTARV